MAKNTVVLTDHVLVPVSAVLNAIKELEVDGQNDPQIITQAFHLQMLPIESSSVDTVVYILKTPDLPDQLLAEISRVLKPGGRILTQAAYRTSENPDKPGSHLERKLLLAGFLGVQLVDLIQDVVE